MFIQKKDVIIGVLLLFFVSALAFVIFTQNLPVEVNQENRFINSEQTSKVGTLFFSDLNEPDYSSETLIYKEGRYISPDDPREVIVQDEPSVTNIVNILDQNFWSLVGGTISNNVGNYFLFNGSIATFTNPSYQICTGGIQDDACYGFGAEGQSSCEAYNNHGGDCTWNEYGNCWASGGRADPVCEGQLINSCQSTYTEGECLSNVDGCSWLNDGCLPVASCFYWDGDEATCNSMQGCSSYYCSNNTTGETCNSTGLCYWEVFAGDCSGDLICEHQLGSVDACETPDWTFCSLETIPQSDQNIYSNYFVASPSGNNSPYQTDSTNLNVNLNADLLDGKHSSNFLDVNQLIPQTTYGVFTFPEVDSYLLKLKRDYTSGGISGLYAHYLFNDNDASYVVLDDEDSHDATASNYTNSLSVSGKINSAFNFANGSSVATIPYTSDFDFSSGHPFSVTAWLYVDGTSIARSIINQYNGVDGWSFYLAGSNQLNFYNNSYDFLTSTTFNVGQWNHVVITHDGSGNYYLCINAYCEYRNESTPPDNLGNILIGYEPRLGDSYARGLDDLRFYNKVLSQSEIDLIYNNGVGTESGAGILLTDVRAVVLDSNNNFDFNSGAKFGTGLNYALFDSNGTLTLHGEASVWNDLYTQVASAKLPAVNVPDWESFTNNTSAYSFKIDDYADLGTIEILHNYKEESNIELHLHLATKSSDNSDRNVTYQIFYSWTNSDGGMFAFPQDSNCIATLTIPANTPVRSSYYLDMCSIDGTGKKIGSQLKTRVKRIANPVGTEPSQNPFLGMVGVHYEIDSLGSNTERFK